MNPVTQLFPVEFLTALAEAAAALARAEERLANFPEAHVLTARIRIAEREALAWLEGEPYDVRQLERDYGTSPRAWRQWPYTFVRVFERPIANKTPPDAARITRWINSPGPFGPPSPAPGTIPSERPLEIYPGRLGHFVRNIAGIAALPRLVAGGHIAAEFAFANPLLLGNTVIGAMLGEQYALPGSILSGGGIAAIGLFRSHIPWRRHVALSLPELEEDLGGAGRDARIQLAWLGGLQAGAEYVMQLSNSMRIWLIRVDEVCRMLRRTSRLRQVCLLAASSPSLTAAQAARALGISRQSATDLLDQGCGAGLLREMTEKAAFRRYVANI